MSVVTYKELQKITGYNRPSYVENCLKKQGVRFFYSKDGVWTTDELLNAAKGLGLPENESEAIL